MSDLNEFTKWLTDRGGTLMEPENRFEKIRVQMPGGDEALVMYVTARGTQEWSPALLELHTQFEASKNPITGYPSSRDKYGGV